MLTFCRRCGRRWSNPTTLLTCPDCNWPGSDVRQVELHKTATSVYVVLAVDPSRGGSPVRVVKECRVFVDRLAAMRQMAVYANTYGGGNVTCIGRPVVLDENVVLDTPSVIPEHTDVDDDLGFVGLLLPPK